MLNKLIEKLADVAQGENVRTEGEALQCVLRHCTYRPGDEFHIVFLLTCELADRRARAEGYESQAHRAACLMSAK